MVEPADAWEVSDVDEPRRRFGLAKLLIVVMLIFLVLHVLSVVAVLFIDASAATPMSGEKRLEAISHVSQVWIPVLAGFVSSAVTYYFAKNEPNS